MYMCTDVHTSAHLENMMGKDENILPCGIFCTFDSLLCQNIYMFKRICKHLEPVGVQRAHCCCQPGHLSLCCPVEVLVPVVKQVLLIANTEVWEHCNWCVDRMIGLVLQFLTRKGFFSA